jgi:hypothetical protein
MYFKQYGELRTGTNYLKRLLEINFNEVTVFGSILGWKHGTYDTSNSVDDTKSHAEWIDKQTRDGIVYSVDNIPIKYKSTELRESLSGLKYIFSIKRPVSFVLSFKKFRMPNRALTDAVIVKLCHRYNERYTTWLSMFRDSEESSIIVPYESLIMDYNHILLSVQLKFDLQPKQKQFTNETKTVKASTDVGLIIDKERFNTDYYLYEHYLNDISERQVAIIYDTINHELIDNIYREGL